MSGMPLERTDNAPIGLIAGWGSFPIEVAREVTRQGGRVCCIAIKGHACESLEAICDRVAWSGVGKVGGHIRYFRRHGVKQVTMAGKLFKSDLLFSGSLWLKHLPDIQCLRTFGPLLFGRSRDARDDRLLLAVTDTYNQRGLQVCAPTDFAPELLVKHGLLVGRRLSSSQQKDVQMGWHVARQMGGMDIGQSITIKDGAVIAVEAIEGTDACIERSGQLCKRGGWTLVKVSKPDQDMRFDVPTIGAQTVQKVKQAGGSTIVIEADKTILVDRDKTIEEAKRAGITIVAMRESDFQSVASDAA
ncbi:hypothetical protein Q31b_52300 [Novipirellula aureliae]|uniref:DUF1009 domain-containing protein n=1 Tax=Novipirellula aureliae TaxID=2527966 RepID=A0A5C6DHW2_9BACT|nr:hypothetical protein Q31b_52300 [Novipirellula aureliae]